MRSYDHKHPKGTKYTESELKQHRDNWYKKVSQSQDPQNYTADSVQLDAEVCRRIKSLLPWNGSIKFIRTFNFAGWAFRTSELDDFHKFYHECRNDPSLELIDMDLESLRAEMFSLVSEFLVSIASNTWILDNNSDMASIPSEWEFEQPERFRETVNEIHELAEKIISAYDDFVRQAKRKLAVL